MIDRTHCEALDARDPLRSVRTRFDLPPNTVYLDGNSLGALPTRTAARMQQVIGEEWGQALIRAWNQHDWINLPQRVGGKLARLLGAATDDVIIADSTSVNIFKLLAGALALPDVAHRRVILAERGNFPSDLYIAEGINAMLNGKYTLKLVEADRIAEALDANAAAAIITQVDYCSGRLHDMARLNVLAAKAGTRIVWDLSHSAGAIPLELHNDGAELALGCGYKYLNGGPGAPAFLYLAKHLQDKFQNPLSGWFGHRAPFEFASTYLPAKGVAKLLCGTPSVLATAALECGIDTFDGVSMAQVREKSLALTDLFRELVARECDGFNLRCITPTAAEERGSQLAFQHANAYQIMQALIDRNVIGDFRQPDLLRFGFTPLYLGFADCWKAVATLREVMRSGAWQAEKYLQRNRVT